MSRLTDACKRTFGQTVTYFPAKATPYQLKAIFDANFQVVDPDSETSVSSVHPVLFVKLSDMHRDPRPNDMVRIGLDTYRVIQSQPDSEGATRLLLHRI